ncbi:S46 family peptidase [Stakelama pacifica]|uniref:Dipeptidyl-peptidase n=1 Tax=Stakelama pacifica TaxID=517720 RepID=A0A4R6FZ89_9SPHN|nr:S46 family peptidase [Stakelama pacifica]TDN86455.1 peptidase S46-like protein [Stakelama pacifica]GGO89694.1 dipeptidyl-peptidase [Stakelama pacifica]
MKPSRFATLLASGAASALFAVPPVHADEGMWTFDNFPAAKVNAEYGTDINQAWLDHVRGAAVRLSVGCSASTVSDYGLVLTNNHCVVGCAQNLSSSDDDYYTHGYTANGLSEERKCPGMNGEILMSISDVTNRVTAAGAGKSGSDLVKARNAVTSRIEEENCGDDPKWRCQVVNLYHGGQYKLYKYRRYSDVRLVFSPGVQTAFFGGDPDNFNFPRYDLDSAFVRLYENGKPVATPDHLVWNPAPPKAGEPVFVAGNPGGTDRQLTVSQLETQRDLTLPITALQLSELRGRLIRFSEESAEHKRIAQDLLFGLQNSYKVYFGRLFALKDESFMAKKQAEQTALRQKVAALGPKLPKDFGTPWQTIDTAQSSVKAMYLPYRFVEGGPMGSELFGYARELVRAAAEREKPSADRLPGYADADLPRLQKSLFDEVPVHADLEEVTLEFWLSKAREYLTADSPETKLLLGKESPESLAARLATSKLGDPAVRKALYDGGMAAIKASDDPMIQYALRIDPEARKLRSAWEEQVSGPLTTASEKIAKARFLALGDSIYPDATFTLRLSYGKIAGWTYRGTEVPPFTHFAGLYERATGHEPYKLDPRWIAAKDKLDLSTIFDISTTNDIIGGNSGSPLINAKGEAIGTVFDGNIHSLGGNYGYDAKLNRTVAVSAAAINEALRKVYGADAIADELTGKHKPS